MEHRGDEQVRERRMNAAAGGETDGDCKQLSHTFRSSILSKRRRSTGVGKEIWRKELSGGLARIVDFNSMEQEVHSKEMWIYY